MSNLPKSDHFTIVPVVDGVYQALAADEGGAFGNAGIIDLGGQVLLFDCFVSPQAARDLYKVAQELTGIEPTHVILSHAHSDHYQGACGLPESIHVVSTAINQEFLKKTAASQNPENLAQQQRQVQTFVNSLQEGLRSATDADQIYNLKFQIGYLSTLLDAANEVLTRIPDVVFDDSMTFNGTKRQAIALTYGSGHSPSDVLLYLPEDRVIFTGDIIEVERHSYLGAGDIPTWLTILDKIEALNAKWIVPGHGPVGTGHDLVMMRSYLTIMSGIVEDFIRHGGTAEWLNTVSVPQQFQSWLFRSWMFPTNLNALYKQQTSHQT